MLLNLNELNKYITWKFGRKQNGQNFKFVEDKKRKMSSFSN